MSDAAATRPRRRRWWLFLLALFAFVALGYLPAGAAFTPVGPAFLLVGGAVIACVVAGLALRVRPSAAPLVVAIVGIALTAGTPGAGESYRYLVLGWVIVLSASFGLVSIMVPTQPFLSRGLASIALAITVAAAGAAMFGDGIEKVKAAMYSEAARRADLMDLAAQRRFSAARWRDAETRQPQLAAVRVAYEEWVHSLPQRTLFFLPSLLALQSLAGLALGWEMFHRLNRHQIGPPLTTLRDFRFNDQLVWAIAVGLTILVLPEFADGRAAGANILVFFGALFALRGLAVLASFRRGRTYVPVVGLMFVIAWPIAVAVTLILGLADIWLDVRRRTQAAH